MLFRNFLFLRIFTLCVLLWLINCGLSRAAHLDLKILTDRVVIEAKNVELKEILQAISVETGMQVSYFASETSEVISCRIDEPSMANSLSSLLKNWNYSLVFSDNQNGLQIPTSLWLIDKEGNRAHTPAPEGTIDRMDDHIQHLQKSVFADLFKEEQVRVKQMQVKIVERSSGQENDNSVNLLPPHTGIQITALEPDSAFKKIGLQAGDIIYDVNGTPVKSTKDLINAMNASEIQSIIRIERYTDTETIDPIYIDLH